MSALFSDATTEAPPLGIWVKLPAVEIVELASLAELDFVIIDLEHAPLDLETTALLIATARVRDVVPIVRVPGWDTALWQRLLDAGALGLHVPHVESADQARMMVEATRFPPLGARGSGAMSRAGLWGRKGRAEYMREGNEDVVLVAAVESATAIDAADEILAVEGIDAIFVGAGDLSLALGVPVADPEVQRLVDVAIGAAKRAGKPCGGAARDAASSVRGLARGYGYVTVGNDTSMLLQSATSVVETVRDGTGAA